MTLLYFKKLKLLSEKNFIFLYLIVFALIPIFCRHTLPQDMTENLYWGKEMLLGYPKHPPLFSWIAYGFYKLCFSIPESQYILTELNLAVGIFFIFKISMMLFDDRKKAYASVLISLTTLAFSFGNDKFNANTILLSLLPINFYFFMKFLKFHKISDAFFLGIFAALAVLGKYFSLLFLGLMFVFFVFSREGKWLLKTSLPYVTIFVCFFTLLPHIKWVFENDFITLKYALEKAGVDYINSWRFPLEFIFMQTIFFGSAVLVYFFSSKSVKIIPRNFRGFNILEKFVIYISIVPSATLFFMSLFFGIRIGSMWGVNMISLIGLYILIINKGTACNFIKLRTLSFYFFIIVAIGMILRYESAHFLSLEKSTCSIEMRKIAKIIDSDCFNKFGENFKIKYLNADKKTNALHVYLKDDPSFYSYDTASTPWINEKIAKREGYLYTRFVKSKNFSSQEISGKILFEKIIDLKAPYAIYFAFVKGEI